MPADDVARVRATPETIVLDASERMLLVESEAETLRLVVESLAGWRLAPEQTYEVP